MRPRRHRLSRKTWLLVLPLVAGVLNLGAAPGRAAGESWQVDQVLAVGCADNDWNLDVSFAGQDTSDGDYTSHTVVTAGGRTYMNEDAGNHPNAQQGWGLYGDFSYGPVSNPGTFPIPAGQQMIVRFTLERPAGTVLSSWTLVAPSCDSATLLYNGPTGSDPDGDLLPAALDTCPTLASLTDNGCPAQTRSLSLARRAHPRRLVGSLVAAGHPALSAGRTVEVWKVRPGADRRVRTLTTDSRGRFRAAVRVKGHYYATSPGLLVPSDGQASASTSPVVHVRRHR
jgi:hypothetical protein